MPVKIRLQRQGKKGQAYFHIVIADGRAPRDGKFIEKLGTYNPRTNPASIDIDSEKTLKWLQDGAQPSDTCRAILSYKGIMYRNHLAKGITKGALTQEQADAKFEKWIAEKDNKISGKVSGLATKKAEAAKKQLASETELNKKRAAKIAAKAVVPEPVTETPSAEAQAPSAEETPTSEA
ncbi:MAG TPA: 30S ribosomal protein S16 [Bacteroidia bacterium]|nr:30S ribosomal protein S16 [Bacteroidia bacterium]